jgi:hypothetical protein
VTQRSAVGQVRSRLRASARGGSCQQIASLRSFLEPGEAAQQSTLVLARVPGAQPGPRENEGTALGVRLCPFPEEREAGVPLNVKKSMQRM